MPLKYGSDRTRRAFVTQAVVAATAGAALATELTTQSALAASQSDSGGMLKIISILARKDGESVEDFVTHWEKIHAPLVYSVPGVERYTLSIIKSSSTRKDGVGAIDLKIDGIAELWFKDRASLEAAASSSAVQTVVKDGLLFVGSEVDFIAEEKVIIPRA